MQRDLFLSNKRVFTTGYEGKDIDEFLKHLLRHNIKRVVDVREIPLSRKKGFSKTILGQKLAERDIDYVHIRTLGSPRHLRKKVYKDKDFDYFFEKYENHLEKCKKELEELYELVTQELSCLLCFENNPSSCHRSSVANRVSRINGEDLQIEHI